MWVRAQDGALVNLDHATKVEIRGRPPEADYKPYALVATMARSEWGTTLYEGTKENAETALEIVVARSVGRDAAVQPAEPPNRAGLVRRPRRLATLPMERALWKIRHRRTAWAGPIIAVAWVSAYGARRFSLRPRVRPMWEAVSRG